MGPRETDHPETAAATSRATNDLPRIHHAVKCAGGRGQIRRANRDRTGGTQIGTAGIHTVRTGRVVVSIGIMLPVACSILNARYRGELHRKLIRKKCRQGR